MIVVTGAGGLLGAHLVAQARARGLEIAAWTRTFPLHGAIQLDLLDEDRVRAALDVSRPSCIVHCAALTDVDLCERDPAQAMSLNAEVPARLARLAAERDIRLLHVSTDSVFRGDTGLYTENDRPDPVNVYARSKLEGEARVLDLHPRALVVRTNFYGWNVQAQKRSLAEWVLERLGRGENVPGFTDVSFAPLLVDALAEQLLQLSTLLTHGLLHLASRDVMSKYEFARTIAIAFGHDPELVVPVSIDSVSLGAPRPRNTSLDGRRAAALLGEPAQTVSEGVARLSGLSRRDALAMLLPS